MPEESLTEPDSILVIHQVNSKRRDTKRQSLAGGPFEILRKFLTDATRLTIAHNLLYLYPEFRKTRRCHYDPCPTKINPMCTVSCHFKIKQYVRWM